MKPMQYMIRRFSPCLPAGRYLIAYLSCLFLFASCEKVIDLDLQGAEKKYVIEGVITDQPGGCRVLITQTKDFNEDNDFPGVSGASVRITDQDAGTIVELSETSAGVYETEDLTGISGNTYALEVTIGEEVFTATSVMPEAVEMDTIYVTDENLFGESWKLVNVEFEDPAGMENNYRFIQHINGVKTQQIFIRDDNRVDGRTFSTILYMDPGSEDEDKINSGDEIQVEMQCIDAAVYKYWYSLDQSATGENDSASPANPVTNIRGGSLGYFSAHATHTLTMQVP